MLRRQDKLQDKLYYVCLGLDTGLNSGITT